MDSLIDLFSEQKIKGYENELITWEESLVRTTRFQSSDRTITQLKIFRLVAIDKKWMPR